MHKSKLLNSTDIEGLYLIMMKKIFSIPLQSEIEAYIREKKGWPQKFCEYYAHRFWNNYQASGWKLSNGNAMKDWRAAFNSQWQNLRYKEDIDFFNKCMAKEPSLPQGTREIAYLNDVLNDYRTRWDKIPESQYAFIYDYLKERRMVKMTQEEKENAKAFCNGDIVKGKALAVKMIFDRMITNNESFQ